MVHKVYALLNSYMLLRKGVPSKGACQLRCINSLHIAGFLITILRSLNQFGECMSFISVVECHCPLANMNIYEHI